MVEGQHTAQIDDDDYRAEQSRDPLFTLALILAALVGVTWAILMVLGATRTAAVEQAEVAIAQYDKNLQQEAIQSTLTDYLAVNTVVTQMSKIREQRFLFFPIWDSIKQSVPKDVQFTNISLGQDNVFRITGVTKSVTSVAHFAKELSNHPNLTQVAPLSVDKQSNNLYSFTLSFKAVTEKSTTGDAS